ncbi:hypothetical protein [Shewanella benthica]|uniref:Uncharacterized protein n=1 Tax=Shewanella benthica KT99 TaxID=314608 RepID=A9D5X8_9GAMM|nr:hypothetical protein KT99_17326 [Shewanella benthica KT99]
MSFWPKLRAPTLQPMLNLAAAISVVMIAMTIIGLCGGVGLCIADTIVVSVWKDKIQSTMLVVQDAMFKSATILLWIFISLIFHALRLRPKQQYSYCHLYHCLFVHISSYFVKTHSFHASLLFIFLLYIDVIADKITRESPL